MWFLLAGNGSGKTTLLKAILGRLLLSSGEIIFQERSISMLFTSQIVASGIALVPEGTQIFGALSVADNLLLGAYHRTRRGDPKVKQDVAAILDFFPSLRGEYVKWQVP